MLRANNLIPCYLSVLASLLPAPMIQQWGAAQRSAAHAGSELSSPQVLSLTHNITRGFLITNLAVLFALRR